MEAPKLWSCPGRRRPAPLWLVFVGCVLAGCALGRGHLEEALLANHGTAESRHDVAEGYLLGCPDVLQVTVSGHPELTGRRTIGPDGRIDLGDLGRVRMEGLPVAEAARHVAEEAELPPDQVQVQVQEYNSQQVYLFGEVSGLQRAVPYQGPETVLDLLQRVGGLTPGAAPGEVQVVRPHVAEGRAPEVFHIDLEAILLRQDPHSNLRLQPFDQIHVGESRESCFSKFIPPCLRGLYETAWGISR